MRTQAIEKLGKMICEQVDQVPPMGWVAQSPEMKRLKNLCTKFRILTNRDANPASVIREIMNNEV